MITLPRHNGIRAICASPFPLANKVVQQVQWWLPSTLKCRIPDDCIDSKRYPLFMARAVLQELIESFQSTQGVKPC